MRNIKERRYKVYAHINKINGKIYIGRTGNDLEHRSGVDGKGYELCECFYKAIKEYGWNNFEHIVVIDNLTKEESIIIENELIYKYKTTNSEYGYNITINNRLRNMPDVVRNNGKKKKKSKIEVIPRKKSMSIQIEESLQDAFRDKCKSENLKYSEVAEALLQAYVEGSINVAIETKYKVTPKAL